MCNLWTMTSSGSPSPDPKPPLNEQIADIALKVIMTGGVAGGGLGAFWSLFKNSDVPKAIAAAIIGLGISYGAKMLMPVHKGNQRRLEEAGKNIDESLDWVTEQVIARATGFENKYLLCQAADCQSLRSEGVPQQDGIFIPLLKEVFVPLELDFSAIDPGFKAFATRGEDPELYRERTIWEFLTQAKHEPTFRQMAILAWGGYGKTTLLKHIAFRYGTKQPPKSAPKLTPILLILRKYRDLLSQDDAPDLSELIIQHHIPGLPGADGLRTPTGWADNVLKQGKALVMLDGFDEVGKAQRQKVAQWIAKQMRQYGKSIFILTSRPKAYRKQAPFDRLTLTTSLWVRDFSAHQREKFVTRWYECQERYANVGRDTPDVKQTANQSAKELLAQIEDQPALRDLAKNPLLLNMITNFHRRYPGADLPKRRVELYREICLLQLRDRPRARKLDTVLTQCNAQRILQRVAFVMMQKHWERIQKPVLLKGLAQILKSQEETIKATDFLEQVVQISELLVQQEDEYEFAHLSFQEYLAAAYIAQHQAQQRQEQILYEHFNDDWWKPTILLYVAQVNPTRLLREAINREATDLAYLCLQETTKQVDAELARELQAVSKTVVYARYESLETSLKNSQWQEADYETYRLMITTVGKEEGQYLSPEELLNFPCDALQTLDRLWVSHSKGKYGFSVQKEIYLKCGGKPDGRFYDYTEEFYKFGYAVGWIRNGYWGLSMDRDVPMGHLPGVICRYRSVGPLAIGRSLLCRLVACEKSGFQ